MDDLGGPRGGQVRVRAGDRHEHDVDVTEALEIRRRQSMPEVAEVTDEEVVEPDREHGVTAARRSFVFVVERAEAGDEHLAYLVLAGPAEHDRLSGDRLQAGVAEVVVGDGNQTGFGARDGVAGHGYGRTAEDDAFTAAHAD